MKLSLHPLAIVHSDGHITDVPLDHALIARLRASMNHLTSRGDALAASFYDRLFKAHPSLRWMFPEDMNAQRAKLMSTLAWAVANLSHPAKIREAAVGLGQRHVHYGAKPEHYPVVCSLLLESMAEVSGDHWSASLEYEWKIALFLLSELMQQQPAVERTGHVSE